MTENLPLGHLKITPGGLPDFLAFVEETVRKRRKDYCIPLNLTKYVVSKSDEKLQKVINSASFVIADGVPIRWLSRRLGYRGVKHISGIELAEAILSQSRSRGWKIFLLGATPENLEKAITYLAGKFNKPLIVGSRHGYFKAEEVEQTAVAINATAPDILLLGLGMPQKEYFIDDYFHRIDAHFWLPVGGAFDIWAQTKKRSHSLVQKFGLEWLQRSIYNGAKARNILRYGLTFFKDYFFTK
jgi:N-acetylglucosaminyldiphosphoundecaprenol N-acetyl-beta-D-mannosaminyltransferase